MISESERKKGIYVFDCNSKQSKEVYNTEKLHTPSLSHLTVLIFNDNELVENVLPVRSAKK